MNERALHAARASLYENIADVLAEPPLRDWFISALSELKTRRPPDELADAHAALARAFETATHEPRQWRPVPRAERKKIVEKVLAILHVARLAAECAYAGATPELDAIEDRQADFFQTRAVNRLKELADELRKEPEPFYSELGEALGELVRHDLQMVAA